MSQSDTLAILHCTTDGNNHGLLWKMWVRREHRVLYSFELQIDLPRVLNYQEYIVCLREVMHMDQADPSSALAVYATVEECSVEIFGYW